MVTPGEPERVKMTQEEAEIEVQETTEAEIVEEHKAKDYTENVINNPEPVLR
jgi:hypothetical protein